MKKPTLLQTLMQSRWGWLWGLLIGGAITVIVKTIVDGADSMPVSVTVLLVVGLFAGAWYVGR